MLTEQFQLLTFHRASRVLTLNSDPPNSDHGLQSLAIILPGQHWNTAKKEQCSVENVSVISH